MSSTTSRSRALLGAALAATLLVAAGLAVWAKSGPAETAAATSASSADTTQGGSAGTPEPTVTEPATAEAPATTVPPSTAPPTTAARPRATTPTTAAPKASPPTMAPSGPATTVAPQFRPGARINPTSAQVQAAIVTLHRRIPLFQPNEAQMRTFADTTCSSFDQGLTKAQVTDAVRQAVTYIQGASISAADAEFAVKTAVDLRCPGYV